MMQCRFGHLQIRFVLVLPPSFLSFFHILSLSIPALRRVILCLNSIADVLSSIPIFYLRHAVSGSFPDSFIRALLLLTRISLTVSLDRSGNNPAAGVVWTAWCQKELSNYAPSKPYMHSEMIFSLFRAILVV